MTLPPDTIQAMPTYDLAKAAFEAQPSIRVLFDNGAGNSSNPGWPYPAFEQSFAAFPVPGTTARSWYLAPGGALADAPASGTRADAFTWDADARPLNDFTGDTGGGDNGLWTATPAYQWSQDPARHAVAYVTEPLSADTTVVGAGRVDLWVRSSAPNVDLQVTISEVRPDGKETFVQNGWVRANARALDEAKSTELEPVLSLREEDFAPMPSDQLRAGHGPALLRGARLSRGLAHPRQGLGAQRRPADLVVQRDRARRNGGGRDRLRQRDAVPPRPPAGAGRRRAGSASAVPGPARRAVSRLRAVRERHLRPRRLPPPEGRDACLVSLVPAYRRVLGAQPLARRAALPVLQSAVPELHRSLTVGTPEATARRRSRSDALRRPGDPVNEADVTIAFELTDVRRKGDLADYRVSSRPARSSGSRTSKRRRHEPGTVRTSPTP